MPSEPPLPETSGRFDPVFVTSEDLDDLASFTGMSHEQCLERLRNYSSSELAEAWRQSGPQTPEEIVNFYQSTGLYIWELMQWHASTHRLPYWEALSTVANRYTPRAGWRRVYDFGAGVGTDALFLASQGYHVTLADVSGITLRFARHRFERRGLQAKFLTSQHLLPQPDDVYDIVVSFDVFEHLPNPLECASRLIQALRPGGLLVQCANFVDQGQQPCHLPEGIQRFSGLRWHIHLAGLGTRQETAMIYHKVAGLELLAQRLRFRLWQLTGLWLVRASK